MNDLNDFSRKQARYYWAIAEANQRNKDVLFDALQSAAITSLTVTFDGEGDSGQIESVKAYSADLPCELPKNLITLLLVYWGQDSISGTETALSEAVETLCYNFLTQEHDGWENNDGAYGEFEFDVAARTITLEFNGRYTDVHTSEHSF